MIKENTLIHGNAKYIVRFGETRIGLSGQQSVKFLKYDEAGKLITERELLCGITTKNAASQRRRR